MHTQVSPAAITAAAAAVMDARMALALEDMVGTDALPPTDPLVVSMGAAAERGEDMTQWQAVPEGVAELRDYADRLFQQRG